MAEGYVCYVTSTRDTPSPFRAQIRHKKSSQGTVRPDKYHQLLICFCTDDEPGQRPNKIYTIRINHFLVPNRTISNPLSTIQRYSVNHFRTLRWNNAQQKGNNILIPQRHRCR